MRQFKIQQSVTNRGEKSIEKYFNDLNKFEPLTAEEEKALGIKIKEGDSKALDTLVKANLRFVVSVAKKYQNQGLELGDLFNEGNLGLIKAAQEFDHTRGFKFISFAVWWIRQSIIQALSEKKRMVKVPSNKNLAGGKYLRAVSELTLILEREPTAEEIAEFMEIAPEDIHILEETVSRHSSLDANLSSDSDGSSCLMDFIEDDYTAKPDDSLIDESLKLDVDRALEILSSKESYIIKSIYGIGCKEKSKDMIAIELDYTPERIRQIKICAERKIANSDSARKLLLKYI